MNEYRQNAINHLKTHLGCVGYRDYLIAELEKLEKIEQVVNDWSNGDIEGQDTILAFHLIKEVLEKE